jgi:hypothetical protein
MKKLVALTLATCVLGCDTGSDGAALPGGVQPDEYVTDCEGAAGGAAFASDESWASFVNAHAAKTVTVDDCLAPQVTMPAAGAELDPEVAPYIAFLARRASCGQQGLLRTVPRPGLCAPAQEGWLTRALGLLLLESPALAHCPAVTGTNYWLKLSTASGEVVYSALLSVTTYTPNAAIWKAKLSAHRGEALTLVVERGEFSAGDLRSGPFAPPTGVPLKVKP